MKLNLILGVSVKTVGLTDDSYHHSPHPTPTWCVSESHESELRRLLFTPPALLLSKSLWIDHFTYRHSDKFTAQDSWFLDYLQPGDGALTDTGAMQSVLGDSSLHGCFNSCREGNHMMESKLCPSLWSPEQIKRCPSEKHLLTVPFH